MAGTSSNSARVGRLVRDALFGERRYFVALFLSLFSRYLVNRMTELETAEVAREANKKVENPFVYRVR